MSTQQQSNFCVQSSHRFISDKKNSDDINIQLDEIKYSENKVLNSKNVNDFFIDEISNDIDQIINNTDIEEKDNNLLNFINKSNTSYNSGMSIRTTNNSKEDYY